MCAICNNRRRPSSSECSFSIPFATLGIPQSLLVYYFFPVRGTIVHAEMCVEWAIDDSGVFDTCFDWIVLQNRFLPRVPTHWSSRNLMFGCSPQVRALETWNSFIQAPLLHCILSTASPLVTQLTMNDVTSAGRSNDRCPMIGSRRFSFRSQLDPSSETKEGGHSKVQ